MDKLRQFQKITNIKPQYKKLTHPFHKTSMTKIKFLTTEYELQYNDIGVWELSSEKNTTQGGHQEDPVEMIILADMLF